MKAKRNLWSPFLVLAMVAFVAPRVPGQNAQTGMEGYAGPGWSYFFGLDDLLSRGPLLFRVSDGLFIGPQVLYSESSAEGPSRLLGGMALDWYPRGLQLGWLGLSMGLTLSAGAENLLVSPVAMFVASAHVEGNLRILPGLTLAAGPSFDLIVGATGVRFLPGLSLGLKEGASGVPRTLISFTGGPHVEGYWQGLLTSLDGRAVFIDGGGTRVVFPSGLSMGITGGVLRARYTASRGDLAAMHAGATLDWTWHPLRWLELSPRVTTGVGMYGWLGANGALVGGPTFIVRPEIAAFLRVLPFARAGAGIGYLLVVGDAAPGLSTSTLSSLAISLAVRVGE